MISEIRSIGRRQVEIFVLYDMLQKYGVRLETVSHGSFEDSAMGRHILSVYALQAELEREQIYARLQRGRIDRMLIGNAPGNGQRCFGFILKDSLRETHAIYEYSHEVYCVDDEEKEWSEYQVACFMLEELKNGLSLRALAIKLNDMGIPPRGKSKRQIKPLWHPRTIARWLDNPLLTGQVYQQRYKRDGKKLVRRPKEEWILLDATVPAYLTEEELMEIKRKISYNKNDSTRNNKHRELGLLRGYILCGICGKKMHVVYPSPAGIERRNTPLYRCETPYGKNTGTISFHRTQIHMKVIDELAKKKIVEVLLHPEQVRLQVEEWRKENREVVDPTDIEEAAAKISKALDNLYKLGENAADDEELARIQTRMKELGKQKRDIEAMLYNLEEDKEEREVIEAQLQRFEKWVENVSPFLSDPAYMETADYEELRAAINILGLITRVYPTQGDWPYRHNIEVTVPEVRKAVEGQSKTWLSHNIAFYSWLQ